MRPNTTIARYRLRLGTGYLVGRFDGVPLIGAPIVALTFRHEFATHYARVYGATLEPANDAARLRGTTTMSANEVRQATADAYYDAHPIAAWRAEGLNWNQIGRRLRRDGSAVKRYATRKGIV